MGLFTGTVSYVRYRAQDKISDNIKDVALEKLKEFSFKEIDPLSLSQKTIGWVSAENMASTFFDDLHFAKEPYLVFALRIDVRRIPALTVKAALLREEIKYKKSTGLERLNKKDKEALKDQVLQNLTKKTLPTPAVYDVCFNIATDSVLFFSNSLHANEEFVGFFYRTFDIKLFALTPFDLAGCLVKKKKNIEMKNLTINFTDG